MTTVFDRIEKLKQEYTDKYVVVDPSRPELARFRDMTGVVKTVNMNGRALVEFDGENNIGWFDIELDYLKVVDQPLPKKEAPAAKPAKKAPAAKASADKAPSPLEKARAEKAAPAAKPAAGKKMSTADILAAARAKKSGDDAAAPAKEEKAPAEKSAAEKAPAAKPGKMSTADILAAARAEKKAEVEKPAESKSQPTNGDGPAKTRQAEPAPVTAQTEEATEESAAGEAPAESPAPVAKPAAGDLPTDTAGKIAWCRQHDGK